VVTKRKRKELTATAVRDSAISPTLFPTVV